MVEGGWRVAVEMKMGWIGDLGVLENIIKNK